MKSFYKIITLALLMLGLFSVSGNVWAEETLGEVLDTKKVDLVATVNIYDAKIISQNDNIFNISFNLNNKEIMQSGLKYGIELIKETPLGQYTVDYQVYDETINLVEHSNIVKNIIYTAPSVLEGDFRLVIRCRNDNGFPFASSSLGIVKLSSSNKGVEILTETCFLEVVGEKNSRKYTLTQGVDISENEKLSLNCQIKNNLERAETVSPFFETYYRTIFGKLVEQTGGDNSQISIKPKEEKTISIILSKATEPQAYDVKMKLKYGDNFSNSVISHYVLKGLGATIQNLSLDKDYYQKKEIANISFLWSPSADNFPGSRLEWTDASKINLSLIIINKDGENCGDPINQTLDFNFVNPKVNISYAINNKCLNPKVTATLIDNNGNKLDEKNFNFETTSSVPKFLGNNYLILIIIVIFLLAILILGLKKRNKEQNFSSGVNGIFLFFIFFVITGFIIPLYIVKAETYTLGDNTGNFWATVEVTINKDVFNPGENITSYGSVTYSACANDAPTAKMVLRTQRTEYVTNVDYTPSRSTRYDGNDVVLINSKVAGGVEIEKWNTRPVPSQPSYGWEQVFMTELIGNDVGENLSEIYYLPFIVEGASDCQEYHYGCTGSQTAISTKVDTINNKWTWQCPPITDTETNEDFLVSNCEEQMPATGICDLKSTTSNRVDGKWYTVPAYKCLAGTPGNINMTDWTWTCTSTDGVPVSCTFPKNGKCTIISYGEDCACEVGNVIDCTTDPISGLKTWTCDVLDPGSDDFCQVERPSDESVAGVCDNTKKDSCSVGSLIDQSYTGYNSTYYWKCEGLNGGATSPQCSFDATSQPYGSISANPSSCIVPLGGSSCSGILISYDIQNYSVFVDAHAWDGYKNIEDDWSSRGTWQNNNKPYLMDNFATRPQNRTIELRGIYSDDSYIVLDSVNVSAIMQENIPPTAPIIGGSKIILKGTAGNFTVVSTDPDPEHNPKDSKTGLAKDLYYVIDWNSDGVADQWLPAKKDDAAVYVPSGVLQNISHTWPSTEGLGNKTFKIKAIDYYGKESPWSSYAVEIIDETTLTGTLKAVPNPCYIQENQWTCTTSLTLEVINPVDSAQTNVTKPVDVEVISNATINNVFPKTVSGITVNYPSTTFYLNHNSIPLNPDGLKVEAKCDTGLSWVGGKCIAASKPDLIAENVNTSSADEITAGISTPFTADIKNDSSVDINNPFDNLFRITKTPEIQSSWQRGSSGIELSGLNGGESKGISDSVIFPSGGTWHVIACADGDGDINNESEEDNNCSDPLIVIVKPAPVVDQWKASIDVNPKLIIDGRSAKVTWSITKEGTSGSCTLYSNDTSFVDSNGTSYNGKIYYESTGGSLSATVKPRVIDPAKTAVYSYKIDCTDNSADTETKITVIKTTEIEN